MIDECRTTVLAERWMSCLNLNFGLWFLAGPSRELVSGWQSISPCSVVCRLVLRAGLILSLWLCLIVMNLVVRDFILAYLGPTVSAEGQKRRILRPVSLWLWIGIPGTGHSEIFIRGLPSAVASSPPVEAVGKASLMSRWRLCEAPADCLQCLICCCNGAGHAALGRFVLRDRDFVCAEQTGCLPVCPRHEIRACASARGLERAHAHLGKTSGGEFAARGLCYVMFTPVL